MNLEGRKWLLSTGVREGWSIAHHTWGVGKVGR